MDVAGYSRLMGEDEEGTLSSLKRHREELIEPEIAEHRGRIVKLMGDGLLVEFASVVDAVRCAAEVQSQMAERNADLPENRRIEFRVGINLGDIIIDGDDIYGDGINVAARLQELAEPGGVCISGLVRESIQGKLDRRFVDTGEHEVKNISRPLRVWRWRVEEPDLASAAREALPLPDKPSIAVLPFENMSGDAEQEYFSDGITEDIITSLSRLPWFFVIARNSSFAYKGKARDVKKIAQELGVQYVLEGSVRKASDRLRITAQLIDATAGKHVWAERYDRELADVFAIQDEVTANIVGAVAPEFLSFEAKRAQRKDPARLDAWDCVMRGRWHLWRFSREDLAEARRLFERAVALAPSGEFGSSDLALVHLWEYIYSWGDSPARSMEEMAKAARRAVVADDHDAWAQTALGYANLFRRRWDDALPPVERAIELNTSFAPAFAAHGLILTCLGQPDPGIERLHEAIRLSPRDSLMWLWLISLGFSYFMVERYEDAADCARQAIRLSPDMPTGHRQLAASYAMMGRIGEAQAALRELLRLLPGHGVAEVRERLPVRNPDHLEAFLEGLAKAGLPE